MLTSRTFLTISSFAVMWTTSWNAAAQAAAPHTAPAEPPAAQPNSAAYEPERVATTSAPTPEWKKAMTLYELGEVKESLTLLRTKILSCDGESTPTCSNAERAALYMCVGIVLAGGQSNHNGGVQAFKKALSLDNQMRVAPEYSTAPVTNAFYEAYTGNAVAAPATPQLQSQPQPQSQPQSQVQTTAPATPADTGNNDDDDDDDDEPKFDPEKKRLYWLATGGARYGIGNGAKAAVQVGGALGLAGVPGETSGFTLGARVRSGALFSEETIGYIGTQMLVGSTSGARKDNRFNFIFGGVGFENYFDYNSSAVTGHFFAGTSVGGLILSGGIDVAIGSEVGYAIFGIEVGFGTLIL